MVDNGSRDRTADVARAAGARVVREPRRGYGQACLAGIAAAGERRRDRVPGRRLQRPSGAARRTCWRRILAGEADLVIGSRRLGRARGGRALPGTPCSARASASALMNLLFGTRATDLGPVPRDHAPSAAPGSTCATANFGWTVEMQVKARCAGCAWSRCRWTIGPRIGRSKVSGTLVRHRARRQPRSSARSPATSSNARRDRPRSTARDRGPRALAGLAISLCVATWALAGRPDGSHRRASWRSYGLAFAAYLVALAHGRAARAACLRLGPRRWPLPGVLALVPGAALALRTT